MVTLISLIFRTFASMTWGGLMYTFITQDHWFELSSLFRHWRSKYLRPGKLYFSNCPADILKITFRKMIYHIGQITRTLTMYIVQLLQQSLRLAKASQILNYNRQSWPLYHLANHNHDQTTALHDHRDQHLRDQCPPPRASRRPCHPRRPPWRS